MSANSAISGNQGPAPVNELAEAHSIIPSPDPVQLLPDDPDTIGKLAWCSEEANRALATSKDQAEGVVKYARKCGEYLNRAKELLPHGEFHKWLQRNFNGSARTAHNYRRLASNWHRIADLPLESVADAIALIRLGDSPPEAIPDLTELKNGTSAEQAGTKKLKKAASGRVNECLGLDSAAQLVSQDDGARSNRSIESSRASGGKDWTVIVLLKKHLKAGPTEAVREELRRVQKFCREELAKLDLIMESHAEMPEAPSLP